MNTAGKVMHWLSFISCFLKFGSLFLSKSHHNYIPHRLLSCFPASCLLSYCSHAAQSELGVGPWAGKLMFCPPEHSMFYLHVIVDYIIFLFCVQFYVQCSLPRPITVFYTHESPLKIRSVRSGPHKTKSCFYCFFPCYFHLPIHSFLLPSLIGRATIQADHRAV